MKVTLLTLVKEYIIKYVKLLSASIAFMLLASNVWAAKDFNLIYYDKEDVHFTLPSISSALSANYKIVADVDVPLSLLLRNLQAVVEVTSLSKREVQVESVILLDDNSAFADIFHFRDEHVKILTLMANVHGEIVDFAKSGRLHRVKDPDSIYTRDKKKGQSIVFVMEYGIYEMTGDVTNDAAQCTYVYELAYNISEIDTPKIELTFADGEDSRKVVIMNWDEPSEVYNSRTSIKAPCNLDANITKATAVSNGTTIDLMEENRITIGLR
jgi:hypothetical protein